MARPSWMSPRLYQWVKPRSLGLHLLFVLIAGGCVLAAFWQVHRAAQGNVLSYFYSVEWPAFAIVAGIGWWQMFHDTPEDLARRRAYHDRMRRASAEVVARTLPRSATALTVGSAEVRPAVTAGSAPGQAGALEADRSAGGQTPPVPVPVPVAARRPLPAELGAVLLGDDSLDPDDELGEYNRYLAGLAVKGRPKTWRNPRGEAR